MVENDKPKPLEIDINWYDRTVGFFSPKALLKRKRAKIYNKYLEHKFERKYEGADSGRRTKGWRTNNQSANAEIAVGQPKVRDRSRDLIRNNPYAARGVQVISNNVVGKGIMTQIKMDTRAAVSTKEKRANATWRAWAGTPACDFEGIHTMAGLQRLAMRAVVESGEVLIRRRLSNRRFVTGPDGKQLELPPLKLQVLEADFLATTLQSGLLKDGNQIIQGIEIDPTGKKVAYHLFLSHPGSNTLVFASRFRTVRIPASEILHLYRMDRPGQLRGMPWLAPTMLRLKDFDLYEDAQLKRQQCAAMFTAFIHDLEGLDADEETKEEVEIGEKMEPGIMEILPPGKDIKLSNPPGADNYKEYTSVVLRSIASGLGITYEALTNDLSEVNFSSARMGWLEMARNIETWRANIMISQFMRPTFDWYRGGLDLIGETIAGMRPVFAAPRREMIDPVKETQALKMAVRSGFKTQSGAIRELGEDPDTHFNEIESDNKTLDDKKITLDTDPRKVNNAGMSNEEAETTPPRNTD